VIIDLIPSNLGRTGFYLALLIFVSVLLCLAQIAFQIFLAVVGNDIIAKCEFLEILLRHVGLVRLDALDVLPITQWLAPEVISLIGSIIIFIVLKKASSINLESLNNEATSLENQGEEGGDVANGTREQSPPMPSTELDIEKWRILVRAGKILSLLTLCATGALQPSVLAVVYYITFLGAATWWGLNKQLERYEANHTRFIAQSLINSTQGVWNCSSHRGGLYDASHNHFFDIPKSVAAGVCSSQLDTAKVSNVQTVKRDL
jgi:hypothetical protein